jgi:16S rRNA C967 or C1407 C5-methylase (RsmB/RsmF family)/NOL1/NOP2/fmu family ribosome biogenesis protein
LEEQFPTEFREILEAFDQDAPISVRYNLKKYALSPLASKVPWLASATYLEKRPLYALDPLFHSGAYYPQEASSMILESVVKYITSEIEIKRCLDLCASPGGKSTHLLSLLPEKSVLVSNEIISKRFSVLYENLIKWGYPNFIATNARPDQLKRLDDIFDMVLVDAPCSGEGLFRKQIEWREEWTQDNCNLCAGRQHQILDSAMALVRSGGFLIYSTCTLNPNENLSQIEYILKNEEFESVIIPGITTFGFIEQHSAVGTGYLALPNRIEGEPFFIACVRRKGDTTPIMPRTSRILFEHRFVSHTLFSERQSFYRKKDELYDMNSTQVEMAENLDLSRIRQRIPAIGIYKKDIFLPEHFSAMHVKLFANSPRIELDINQALCYLRHEPLDVKIETKGWILLTYQAINIGWIKYDGRRIINKYPMNWRLRLMK